MKLVDRRAAGRQLSGRLMSLVAERPIIMALPRGGVPVAFEVARALGAPLEILAVRKLGAPGHEEFGVGAITEDGNAVLDRETARRVGMTQGLLDATIERETRELLRRVERYRDGRMPIDVRGRTVIVVDDGVATGLTDLAAVRALRGRGASRIIVAVPVGSRDSLALLAEEADEVVCTMTPEDFRGVGRWYQDFSPVEDDEVMALLGAAAGPEREIHLAVRDSYVAGDLTLPANAHGLVIFAHGSGSSRLSPRNRVVATALNQAGFATLLFDLLTAGEAGHRALVFDIALLAERLELVTRWVREEQATRALPIGYFGASTGAAAALRAAAVAGDAVRAVVSRGGRPDMAGEFLPDVTAPTLLIVGSEDPDVLEFNRSAAAMLNCAHQLEIVPGAGHLFEEPGTLDVVQQLATGWFSEHLPTPSRSGAVSGRE